MRGHQAFWGVCGTAQGGLSTGGLRFGATLLLVGLGSAFCQSPPTELILNAKVRDFKDEKTTVPSSHPNFFGSNATPSDCNGQKWGVPTVADNIDTTDQTDTAFQSDNRGPRLLPTLDARMSPCFTPADKFLDWYNDKDTATNRPFLVPLKFTYDSATSSYGYDDQSFFPLDAGKTYKQLGPLPPYGPLNPAHPTNNYGFTLEFHTKFAYQKGKNQVFNFRGDDDVWVFINGKKVIDLGGVHGAEVAAVTLDSIAASIGLQDGNNYLLDFFYAERHCCSSTIRISTSLEFLPLRDLPTPILPPNALFPNTFPVAIDSIDTNVTYYYTTDGSKPDSTSKKYTGPIVLNSTTTINVIAVRPGWKESPVATGIYTKMGELPTPVATHTGPFVGTDTVVVTVPNVPDAEIHCTQDGSAPDSSSALYTGPITVDNSLTLKCKAYKKDWVPSPMLSVDITRLSATEHAVYTDANGDGRIDGAVITLDVPPASMPASVTLTDPFSKSVITVPGANITAGPSANVIIVTFPTQPMTFGTVFDPGPYGQFPNVPGFGAGAFTVSDSVGPVPTKAVSHNKQSPEDQPYVDITFTEPLWPDILKSTDWPFQILRNGAVEGDAVVVVSIVAVEGEPNTYRWTFAPTSPAFPVFIDSLTLGGTSTVKDVHGNVSVTGGKKIQVEGDPLVLQNQLNIQVISAIKPDHLGPEPTYPPEVQTNPFAVTAKDISLVDKCLNCTGGKEQYFLQPRAMPEWIVKTKYAFHYSFQIFDNLAQFVATTSGDVTDEMIRGLPQDANGFKALHFKWIPISKDKSKAGTGAYILRGVVINHQNEAQKGSQGESQIVKEAQTAVLLTFGYLRPQ